MTHPHQSTQPSPLTISVEEAARRLGVPAPTLRTWIRRDVIPSLRIGGRRLVRVADLERLILAGARSEAAM